MKSPTKMSTKENSKHFITSLEARKRQEKHLSPGFLTYIYMTWRQKKHPQQKMEKCRSNLIPELCKTNRFLKLGSLSKKQPPGFQLKILVLLLVTSQFDPKSLPPRVVRTTTRNLLGWCRCCSWWCRCCWWRWCRCWRCLWFSPSIREILKLSEIHVMIGFDTMNFE